MFFLQLALYLMCCLYFYYDIIKWKTENIIGLRIYVVFIDYEKAFDSLTDVDQFSSHDTIICAIEQLSPPPPQ